VTSYYSLCLDLRGWPCVVVGGGAVAARKVRGLLANDGQVTVVAPTLGPELSKLVRDGRIKFEGRRYENGDLDGARLAVAATDDVMVNAAVAAEARRRGILVNVVDDPAAGNFVVPAIVRRGELSIAVSTGGASPAIARQVREDLERWLPPEYAALLTLVAELRAELRREGVHLSAEQWRDATAGRVAGFLRDGDPNAAQRELRAQVQAMTRERLPGGTTAMAAKPRARGDSGGGSSNRCC
jgi:precorrin-2 dehydrogenase/sirohydrochlorin ferrochelatase